MIKQEDKLWWLKEAIVSYIKRQERVDNVEIVSYMGLRCDITLNAINELEEENLIGQYWNGRYYEVRLKKW